MNVARLRSPVYALCLSILAVAAACGTADVAPKPNATTTGSGGTAATTGSGGSGSGTAGSSATAGAGGAGVSSGGGAGTDVGAGGAGVGGAGGAGGMVVLEPATPLPLVVDTFYAASGFMGDGATPGAIVLASDCPARAPGGVGKCSKFTYTPIMAAGIGMGWGGVYWQAPANNWGTMPGKHIEAGATKVTFYAAGAKGGEVVTFIVGGITGPAYQDPPKVQLPAQVLTTTMTQYTIDLTGYTYVSIIGGFGWTIEATAAGDAGAFDPTPISFYVDAIQWVK